MSVNVKTLIEACVEAAREAAGDRWPAARAVAEFELHRLARAGVDIERLHRAGAIDGKRARLLFGIHRGAARTALLAVEGSTAIVAADVVDTASPLIGAAINDSLGIDLI